MNRKWIVSMWIILLPLLVLLGGKPVLAGDINGNEARVIGVASGTFEYNGEKYKAKQYYVESLKAKLSLDKYDLSAEEADMAIAQIFANVETGVAEGYIVKVDENSNQSKDKDEPDEGKPDEPEQNHAASVEKEQRERMDEVVDAMMAKEGETKDFKVPSVIKETGFSLQGTLYVAIGGILALVVCVFTVNWNRKR